MAKQFGIGVDVGGTFTDLTYLDKLTGEMKVDKVLTTPSRPEDAVMQGVGRLTGEDAAGLAECSAVIHATTLATNAVIERKGGVTALLTTRGFGDVLEIGRGYRYDLYDLHIRRPKPLITRPFRFEVSERVASNGRILIPLAEEEVREAAARMREAGVKSVAVCFLHSYRNSHHEVRAAEILAEILPEATVSLSHQVIPEPKEYERTSTTAVDAYIKPTMTNYLDRMTGRLRERGYNGDLLVMLSNGGSATAETAKQFPVQMLESGPAAGVEAASFFGRMLDIENLLAFDMGGTTAKLCVVQGGRPGRTRSFEIHHVHRFKSGSGLPVSLPVYDLLEIGAGGGSIARVDNLGLLQIGPDSAAADPGPACYGRGGTLPTVTDADVVLGYLDPDNFLGGEMKLDANAAHSALTSSLGGQLGLDAIGIAWGVHNLVNENMAAAAQVHVAERGCDPSSLSMVAFGGAGPIHALGVARKLGCRQLIVPPRPGVLSAIGLLVAPLSFERSRSIRAPLAEIDLKEMRDLIAEVRAEIRSLLPKSAAAVSEEHMVELWHDGQDHPVEVLVEPALWQEADVLDSIKARFEDNYKALYGLVDDTPIELVSLRLRLELPRDELAIRAFVDEGAPLIGRRPIYLPEKGEVMEADVYDRARLRPGKTIVGPALIVERESTTIIGVDDEMTVDASGCLIVRLAELQAQPATDGDADAGRLRRIA